MIKTVALIRVERYAADQILTLAATQFDKLFLVDDMSLNGGLSSVTAGVS